MSGYAFLHLPSHLTKQLIEPTFVQKALEEGQNIQMLFQFSDAEMDRLYTLAHDLFDQKHYAAAADAFFFLTVLNPTRPNYWIGLGMASQLTGLFEEAIDAFELAISYDIQNPLPYFYLARCYFAIHDRAEAMHALELTLEYAGDEEKYAEIREKALHARKLIDECD